MLFNVFSIRKSSHENISSFDEVGKALPVQERHLLNRASTRKPSSKTGSWSGLRLRELEVALYVYNTQHILLMSAMAWSL